MVLADGEAVWLGDRLPRKNGYDLTGAFVGSEGTLGIATKVVVRLLRKPEAVRTLLAVYPEMDNASDTVSAVIAAGLVPAAMEMSKSDHHSVEPATISLPDGPGAVL